MRKILFNKEILSNAEKIKELQKDNQKGKNSKKIIELLNSNSQINKELIKNKK